MGDFTIIDGVVAIVIVLSALLAYSRGFVREALAIAGWVVATIMAFIFADQVTPLVKQIPVIGDFIGDSCELSVIAAFAAVFAVVLVIVSIFTPLFSSLIQRSALGGLDQGLGFLFGALRGILTGNIEERDPEAALGWITTQYEQLVGECGAPATDAGN